MSEISKKKRKKIQETPFVRLEADQINKGSLGKYGRACCDCPCTLTGHASLTCGRFPIAISVKFKNNTVEEKIPIGHIILTLYK